MEIALLNDASIRIKGKMGSVIVNPSGKIGDVAGFILLGDAIFDRTKISDESVIVKGPGEYEFGGIKINGMRSGAETVFSLRVDRVEVILGNGRVLEKEHTKLKEHHIALLYNTELIDPSFVTSLASNVVIFYGEKAEETLRSFAKEGYRKEAKYASTFEKLPGEMEKILLAN